MAATTSITTTFNNYYGKYCDTTPAITPVGLHNLIGDNMDILIKYGRTDL